MSYNPSSTPQKTALSGSVSGSFTQFASATTATYSVTWPAAQAASSGYVLSNDGAGNLSWIAQSGGVSSLNSLMGDLNIVAGFGITVTPSGSNITIAASGSGSVTSVALALPSIFTVTGSPVTTSGTLTGALNTQSANMVWAGPASGSAAAPTFRGLVLNDIPSLFSLYMPAVLTTAGDLVYENATPTPARLPIGSTGQVLTVSGGLPAWATPVANNPYYVNNFTLSPTDITNQFITLSSVPDISSDTILSVIGGPMQSYGSDYSVSGSTLSFLGDLATGGNAALVSGDKLVVQFN